MCKFLLVLTVFSLPTWLLLLVYPPRHQQGSHETHSTPADPCQSCHIDPADRFDCHPDRGVTQASCVRRGCCWDHTQTVACYYPRDYAGYTITKSVVTDTGMSYMLSRNTPSPFPKDIPEIRMDVYYETSSRIRIKVSDPYKQRYEVPFKGPKVKHRAHQLRYLFNTSDIGQPFQFNISRFNPSTGSLGKTLLQTAGSLIFSDQFLQLSYRLPSKYIYGLGEHRGPLLLPVNYHKLTLWNKDHPPEDQRNVYGSHPFYMVLEGDGSSHGVYFHNSNAMDVILQPTPAITWRTIGGIFDMYVFLGSSPDDVVEQYTEVVGRPFLPPYWSLGFHLCRFGYPTANRTLQAMDRVRQAGIPQDVQWNDIDYMYKKRVFTTDAVTFGNQSALVAEIHRRGMKYVIIVEPGIYSGVSDRPYLPFQLGNSMDIFVKDFTGQHNLVGKAWPGVTCFPDFSHPNTTLYWHQLISGFHRIIPFDGLWLDMNEISNFVTGSIHGCPEHSPYETPPYLPAVRGGALKFSTLCASARHYQSVEYNLHNLYGLTQTVASYTAVTKTLKKRPFLISRSTFAGSGHYGGHWTGDNSATFQDMAASVIDIINFNMFGVPMVGADICGFNKEPTRQLCQRWYQLGAFYPFSRSHNSPKLKAQDPAAFDQEFSESVRKVYLTRYSLLPYLYTLLYHSHLSGSAVVRSLFYNNPEDVTTYDLETQFFWGSALLISPVLQKDVRSVLAYFPRGVWYDFYSGKVLSNASQSYLELEAAPDVINLHLRGGEILPLQEPALTTTLSRRQPFTVLVAMDSNLEATGELYWDDGASLNPVSSGVYNMIHFLANKTSVHSSVLNSGYMKEGPMVLGNITVLGLPHHPTTVLFNGVTVTFTFKPHTKVLYVPGLSSNLLQPFQLTWSL